MGHWLTMGLHFQHQYRLLEERRERERRARRDGETTSEIRARQDGEALDYVIKTYGRPHQLGTIRDTLDDKLYEQYQNSRVKAEIREGVLGGITFLAVTGGIILAMLGTVELWRAAVSYRAIDEYQKVYHDQEYLQNYGQK